MSQALWILRKDIRRMRLRIAVVWALMAAAAVVDAFIGRFPELANMQILSLPVTLAQWFLAISVVQEDPLVGDRRSWITRPYSWKSLLLAKGLFVLLALTVPELLDHVIALVANGLSPFQYLPDLLWKQAGPTAGLVFAVAMGALTANLVQALLSVIGVYLGLALVLSVLHLGMKPPRGCVAPIDDAWRWAMSMTLFGVACWLQFSRRGRTVAVCVFLCGLVVAFPVPTPIPWGEAFHLIEKDAPGAVRLEPDTGRKASGGSFHMEDGKLAVRLPVRVTAIPEGMEVYSERIRLTLRAANGSAWDSGWDALNELQNQALLTQAADRLLPGAGEPYWLNANIDAAFYGEHREEGVRVQALVAFTMLGPPRITPLREWGTPQAVGGDTICSLSRLEAAGSVWCVAPLTRPALASIRLQPRSPNSPYSYGSLEYPPDGWGNVDGFGIWRVVQQTAQKSEPFTASVEVRQAVAHFERELDMPAVRLKEYREP